MGYTIAALKQYLHEEHDVDYNSTVCVFQCHHHHHLSLFLFPCVYRWQFISQHAYLVIITGSLPIIWSGVNALWSTLLIRLTLCSSFCELRTCQNIVKDAFSSPLPHFLGYVPLEYSYDYLFFIVFLTYLPLSSIRWSLFACIFYFVSWSNSSCTFLFFGILCSFGCIILFSWWSSSFPSYPIFLSFFYFFFYFFPTWANRLWACLFFSSFPHQYTPLQDESNEIKVKPWTYWSLFSRIMLFLSLLLFSLIFCKQLKRTLLGHWVNQTLRMEKNNIVVLG